MSDNDENIHKSPDSFSATSLNQNKGKKRTIQETHAKDDAGFSTDADFEIGDDGIGSNDAGSEDAIPPPIKRPANIEETITGKLGMSYRDASQVSQQDVYSQVEKQQSFPVTLHDILSSEKYASAIVWMPHGRSWKVVDQKMFKNEVLPAVFNHCSTSSFMRQVTNWNFTKIAHGVDKGSYYHQSQSKSSSTDVCIRGETEVPARMLDNNGSPDFHAISKLYPLPEGPIAHSNSNSAASSLMTSTEDYTSTTKGDGTPLEVQQQLQQKRPAEKYSHLPDDNNDKSSPDDSKKARKGKQSNSSSDEFHSFSSSTIPPKSSSSFSTEDDKNGSSNKSLDQAQNRNETTTNTSSLTSKGSETQMDNSNTQSNQYISLSFNRLPRMPIEGRMINFDGSGIIIPSTGVLFGGYTMNQYLIENQFILSRSLFFHPAINNGNTTGAMPMRFNPAVAYPFNTSALPGLQCSNPQLGANGVNQSGVNVTNANISARENMSRNNSGSSSSDTSF
ncbi:hypothetical protein ACHAXS_006554 [Conticribra weissflogii]